LLGEELTGQNCSGRAMQLLPGINNNISDNVAQTGSKLPQVPVATCPVDRRNQIPLKSQSSGETTSDGP
jgi:hypothetical protein